jgi:hypothetical protein
MTKIGTSGHGYFDGIGFPSALLQARQIPMDKLINNST